VAADTIESPSTVTAPAAAPIRVRQAATAAIAAGTDNQTTSPPPAIATTAAIATLIAPTRTVGAEVGGASGAGV
jgi:hypothetical protein